MSGLLMKGMTPEEQQHLMGQMYLLLGKQVNSYYKHRHLGVNSSVPVELAQELMESMEYTLNLTGGLYAGKSIAQGLQAGQDLLAARVERAKQMLQLVIATAPQWQTECRWDALRCIGRFLETYDPLHLAHRIPEELFYPILVAQPEGLRGIDHCMFFLNILWLENQIMAGAADWEQEQLWDRLPRDGLNQCEQLLINGIGKAILGQCSGGLVFSHEERTALLAMLSGKEIHRELEQGAERFCAGRNLTDRNAAAYAKAVIPQMQLRLEGAMVHGDLSALFL